MLSVSIALPRRAGHGAKLFDISDVHDFNGFWCCGKRIPGVGGSLSPEETHTQKGRAAVFYCGCFCLNMGNMLTMLTLQDSCKP